MPRTAAVQTTAIKAGYGPTKTTSGQRGRKTLDAGEVELRLRSGDADSTNYPQDGIVAHIRELVDAMMAEYVPTA